MKNDDFKVAMPTEEMMEISKQYTERKRKESRSAYLKEHAFDILNLIIALSALAISFFGLFLPKG